MSAIRRGPRPQRFDVLDQKVVRDSRMSYRARGVLARLLSNEDGFSMTAADLAREGKEGRGSILSALKELRIFGYVLTRRWQDKRGRWNTESIVYDSPQHQNEPEPNAPKSKKRTSVPRTPVSRVSESSTLKEQRGEQPKKNNNNVGCCDEAQTLISSSPAQLTHKDQQSVHKSLSYLQPDTQVQLLRELIRQRTTINNAAGWMVEMVRVVKNGGFTPSTDQIQFTVHASHLPANVDTLKDKIEQGQQIWQKLDFNQRDQIAVALEKHLASVAPRCLSLKQLRKHGIDHSDVSRELFAYLAEAPSNHGAGRT